MKHSPNVWPPPPAQPEPETDDDWLTANDFITDITWREYAVVIFAVLWGLLACFAVATHHRSPHRATKKVLHIVQTVLP